MKKINIVVAAEDGLYLKQLTNNLIKSEHGFEVCSFTKRDSLLKYLRAQEKAIDILVLCEDMLCEELECGKAVCRILLTEDVNTEVAGYHSVKKYQKTAVLINETIFHYGKDSGKSSQLAHGEQQTRVVGVYSPVGGSGKSTVSLLLAQYLGRKGKNVFYQNFERVNSVREVLPAAAQISLSDLFVSVHSGESGTGLALLSGMCSNQKLGFHYVNLPDSSLEFNEVPLDEQMKLLEEIRQLARFDDVVLDFDSELTGDKLELLGFCDVIVVPFLPDSLSLSKLKQFWRELELHEELSDLKDKMIYVANRLTPEVENYLNQCGILQQCDPAAKLPLSARLANVGAALQSGSGIENELELLIGRFG